MNLDEIRYSVKNLIQRRMRSGLTVLSILIGITAIYTLVSFGAGLQNYIDTLASESGVDKLFIQPEGVAAPGLDNSFAITSDDIDTIDKVNGVDKVVGMYNKVVEVEDDKERRYVFAAAFDPDEWDFVAQLFTVDIDTGRALRDGDDSRVVLGHNWRLAEKLFDEPLQIGSKILVDGRQFEVVGFFEEVGNPQDDSNVYLTENVFEEMNPETEDRYAVAFASSQPGVDTGRLAERITDDLRDARGEEEGKETFFVQTFEDALATFTNIVGVLNAILILIALISLVVASVNTMNTMYTAVLERTKEIGIMKAIGAKNSDIMLIFIFEAGLLGAIGGAIGVILGFLISTTGGAAAAAAGYSLLKPIFPLWLTAGSIIFSFAIGALSGILPARQAARLQPVDALRYE